MADEVTFDYVKALKDDKEVLLIDVREPSELKETGTIPGSINIPLGTLKDILKNMSGEEFQAKFNRDRPELETPLVFSCRGGNRSRNALATAKEIGFVNAKHYPGGWLGWEKGLKSSQ